VFRFLIKPCEAVEILSTVHLALEIKRLDDANERLRLQVMEQNQALALNNASLEKTVAERTVLLRKTLESLKQRHATLTAQRTGVAELLIALIGQYDLLKGRKARQLWESIRFYGEKKGLVLSDEIPYAAMLKVFVDPTGVDADDTFLRLLASVEGFAPIAALIMGAQENYNGTGPAGAEGEDIPLESRLLRIAADYHLMQVDNQTISRQFILNQVHKLYDPEIAREFLLTCHDDLNTATSLVVSIDNLLPGMVLCHDIQLVNNSILLPAGTSLKPAMIGQLRKVRKLVKNKINIYAELEKNFPV